MCVFLFLYRAGSRPSLNSKVELSAPLEQVLDNNKMLADLGTKWMSGAAKRPSPRRTAARRLVVAAAAEFAEVGRNVRGAVVVAGARAVGEPEVKEGVARLAAQAGRLA